MASYNVNALPDYIDFHRSGLIAKTVIGAKSANLFSLLTGVKGPTALNTISTDVVFGDGSACGWDDAGETTLSYRTLTPAPLKVNMSICDKVLLNKWANYLVRVEANKTDRDLPFEEEFINDVINNVNAKIETMIYQGVKGSNSFDGLLTILNTGTATATGADAYDGIKKGVAALPAGVIGKSDVVALVGMDKYMEFMQQMVEKNFYHYNPGDGENEFLLPGTNVKVIGVDGLNGSNKAIVGRLSNLFYGTNLEDGTEVFDLWFSKDNREFRLAIEFTAGVQVAFPDEVAVVTFQ